MPRNVHTRARICERLRSPEIDSAGLCSLADRYYTSNKVIVLARQAGNRFLGSLKGLKIRAQFQCVVAQPLLEELLPH
jgi:hypothetical protein